jgi:RNA polymerase subunit RPABC4/transcription elongation factor Spt4
MALVKCKECGEKVSTKSKACPNCGAKPPKKTSFVTWGVLIIILIALYGGWQKEPKPISKQNEVKTNQAPSLKQEKMAVAIDVLSISGKIKYEVASILGEPNSCSSTKYGEKCEYSRAKTEIVFINKKADWITVNQLNGALYKEDALEILGLPKSNAMFSNSNVMRWANIRGLLEVSIFPVGNKVDYAYIKSRTK